MTIIIKGKLRVNSNYRFAFIFYFLHFDLDRIMLKKKNANNSLFWVNFLTEYLYVYVLGWIVTTAGGDNVATHVCFLCCGKLWHDLIFSWFTGYQKRIYQILDLFNFNFWSSIRMSLHIKSGHFRSKKQSEVTA